VVVVLSASKRIKLGESSKEKSVEKNVDIIKGWMRAELICYSLGERRALLPNGRTNTTHGDTLAAALHWPRVSRKRVKVCTAFAACFSARQTMHCARSPKETGPRT